MVVTLLRMASVTFTIFGDYMRRPAVIGMTDDGCGCFYLIFNEQGMASHWLGNYGAEKDFDEMVEFITDELTGEFKITEF